MSKYMHVISILPITLFEVARTIRRRQLFFIRLNRDEYVPPRGYFFSFSIDRSMTRAR